MRRLLIAAASAAMVLSVVGRAQALTFTANFCPGDPTCISSLTQASITFTEDTATVSDTNDYFVTVTFKGTDPSLYLDEFEFFTDNVNGSSDYTTVNLTSFPPITGTWTTAFATLNNGSDCASGSTKGVCVDSSGSVGAQLNNTTGDVFTLYVNFASGIQPLSESSLVTLRARFSDSAGNFIGPILSPGAKTFNGSDGQTPLVPEPASMALFGTGLALAAGRLRRKRA